MALWEAERHLRITGREAGADLIAYVRKHFGDAPITDQQHKVELTSEAEKTKNEMVRTGYKVYEIGGKTGRDLSTEGMGINRSNSDEDTISTYLGAVRSQNLVVALPKYPDTDRDFLLKDSGFAGFNTQNRVELLTEYQEKLRKEFGNTSLTVEVGTAIDIAHIAWEHHKATGKLLFHTRSGSTSPWLDSVYTVATIPHYSREGTRDAFVGGWANFASGIRIATKHYLGAGNFTNVGVMPLIILGRK